MHTAFYGVCTSQWQSDASSSHCCRLRSHAAAETSRGLSNCCKRYESCKLDITMLGFKQCVKGQTRKNNLLDKCSVNVEGAYAFRVRPPIANSDHNVVHLVPTYKSKLKSSKEEKKTISHLTELTNLKLALIELCGRRLHRFLCAN